MGCTIKGTVIQGKKLGRRLGFPTANIAVGDTPCISDGVYAVRTTIDGKTFCGMANLGSRPSVENTDTQRLLEVSLFDFEGDLYGKTLEVELLAFIRPERRFASIEELQRAVEHDRGVIEEYFKETLDDKAN